MMKALFIVVLGLAVTAVPALAAPLPEIPKPGIPLPVIFDTDMGNDIDDALALAMLHAFASRGELQLVAVTVSKDNPWAAEYVRLIDEYYGRGAIPVGVVHDGKTPEDGQYVRQICERHGRHPDPAKVTDAVHLLRRTLAHEPDGSVRLIQVGFSTNLARLLASGPDRDSNLSGKELVKKKVHSLTVMAGDFATAKPEYNVKTDVSAAKMLFAEWPTDIFFSGFEVGLAVSFPASSIEHDFPAGNPVAEAYRSYAKMPYDRPSWDMTAVFYALQPDRGYFSLSPAGQVQVLADGSTKFQPGGQGPGHSYVLKVDPMQAARVREACIWLASQPK
jgi:inosine-uridine nucleoside N-ribohydrolase